MNAMPMSMRPICRMVRVSYFRNIQPPAASRIGVSQERSSDRTWTTMAEPTSAPSSRARPLAAASMPLAANPVASTAAAVELCRITAMTMPSNAAEIAPRSGSEMARRSIGPDARSTPVRTMRTE